jgi:hypothetical protein
MMASFQTQRRSSHNSGNNLQMMKHKVACAMVPVLVGAFSYEQLAQMHLSQHELMGKFFFLFYMNGFELTSTS